MLSSFVQFNGPNDGESFSGYLYGSTGFFTLWESTYGSSVYGMDLDDMLYGFYVEGQFSHLYMPAKIKLGRYSAKSRSIRLGIPITKNDFHDCTDRERRIYIAHAIEFGAELAASRHTNKLDTDFASILRDIAETSGRYVSKNPTD